MVLTLAHLNKELDGRTFCRETGSLLFPDLVRVLGGRRGIPSVRTRWCEGNLKLPVKRLYSVEGTGTQNLTLVTPNWR